MRNAFLEIRAGTGGDESALFAADLARMYLRFCERRGWRTEVMSESPSDLGGYKELVVRIERRRGLCALKFESGGHRVQRVPATETQGRIHTSACTVAVLPEPDAAEEVRLESERAAHRHVPRQRRRRPARQQDRQRDPHHPPADRHRRRVPGRPLAAPQQGQGDGGADGAAAPRRSARERAAKEAATRKGLIGSGDRSDRIRTYNFPQGRLTDHRIDLTLYKLQSILDGDLDEVIAALQAAQAAEQLAALESGERERFDRRGGAGRQRATSASTRSMPSCCSPAVLAPAAHAGLIAHDERALDARPSRRAGTDSIERRAGGEPLAYLLGEKEFHGIVLRGRSARAGAAPGNRAPWWSGRSSDPAHHAAAEPIRVVDLGTGSGAIALAIKARSSGGRACRPPTPAQTALDVARAQRRRLGLRCRASVEAPGGKAWNGARFDMAIANPPYVAAGDPHLAALRHEPARR